MSFGDTTSQEPTSEAVSEPVEVQEPVQQETGNSTQETESANPFWKDVEDALGPNSFKLIQPHLAKADAEAQKRITSVNQSYEPWKAFAEQGITPDQVKQSIGVVQQLNTNPEAVYQSLQTFLEREGRLLNRQELANEVEDNEENPDGEDPRDAQLRQLQEQQSQIAQFLQDQQLQAQRAAAAQEADSWIESEIDRVKKTFPDFTQDDLKEILRIAAWQTQQTGQDPENLDVAVQQYTALRDRIRTTPRPGQNAPRVPSGPGGTPAGKPVDMASMSKEQRQEYVAQMLSASKG